MAFDLKMEVYTPTLELVGMLNEWKSVIWEEKAFTAGSFSVDSIISTETRELLVKENILWIEGESAGIIEHIEQKADDTGPYITVKGRMLTGILDRRILWGLYNLSGTPAAIMHRLVDDCAINPTRGNAEARKIYGLVSRETPTGGASIQVQMTGDTLLERLETLGRTYGVSFGVAFNAAVPRMEFWTRYGVDRSVNQTENDPVFYSTELDDVLASEYTYDSSQYRNVALVAGEGEGDERTMIVVEEDMPTSPLPPTPPGPGDQDEPVTKYTITATVDPSGSGKVTGAGTYNKGATVNLTATANDGYSFSDWKEDGATVYNEPEYSFTAEKNRDLVAAFAEKQSSRLPAGYTEVQYIHWDGDRTSFALKENIVCNTDRLILKFYPETYGTSPYQSILFTSTTSGTSTYNVSIYPNGKNSLWYFLNVTTAKDATLDVVNTDLNFDIDFLNNKYTVNQQELSGTSSSRSIGTANKWLGCVATNTSIKSTQGKFYQLTHYRNGEVIHDYVPCTNPDGIAGIYDLGSGVFIQNTSTGATGITAGPAV